MHSLSSFLEFSRELTNNSQPLIVPHTPPSTLIKKEKNKSRATIATEAHQDNSAYNGIAANTSESAPTHAAGQEVNATHTATTNLVNNTPQKIVTPHNNQKPKKNELASLAIRGTTPIGAGAGLISLYALLRIYSLNTEIALLEREDQPVPPALLIKRDLLFAQCKRFGTLSIVNFLALAALKQYTEN